MKRLSFVFPVVAGLATGASFSASAAEESAVNWTGAYAGAHLGYGIGKDDGARTTGQTAPNVSDVAGGARPARVSLDTDGGVGGVALGYNVQSGSLLYGIETDIDSIDINDERQVGTLSLPTATPPGAPLNNKIKQSLKYLGTLRLRLGYVNGANMVYATGGLAYGGIEHRVKMFGAANQLQFAGKSSNAEVGYAIGAGYERMLNAPWSITANYLYYDLGSDRLNVAVVPGGGVGYNTKFETAGQLMRLGIGYKY